jgi:mRNA-degrading endonuclease toxin of MazEF toxin-antitoxin module
MTWKRGDKPANWYPRRGDVCMAELDKERPVIVLSSNSLNRFSLDVCIIPISKVEHTQFSLRPKIKAGAGGLRFDSWAKCDQVTTIEKSLIVYPPLGELPEAERKAVEKAVKQSLELTCPTCG